MKKSIIFTILLFVTACTNNNYKKLVDEKFKKSEYDKILVKKEAEKEYYKYDSKKKFWEEEVFLFIEDNKKDGVKLYMGINYRGKDWLYMRSIEFIGDEGREITLKIGLKAINGVNPKKVLQEFRDMKIFMGQPVLFSIF